MTNAMTESIITRLSEKIEDASAEPFPDNPSKYPFIAPVAALLVQYGGSVYVEKGASQRKRKMRFIVNVITRTHHGLAGSGMFTDRVNAALFNWSPGYGAGRFYPIRDFHVSEQKERWQHAVEVECIAVYHGQIVTVEGEDEAE